MTIANIGAVSVLAATLLIPGAAAGGDIALLVQQGTDISVASTREGELVTDLAGRLWRLPRTGGRATAFTPAGEFARRPAISPDGASIAYQVLRDGVFQVMVTEASGNNPRQITSGPWNHLAPAWSPDGRRLAFASDRGGDFSIWETELDTEAMRQLTFEPGQEFDPAWEPGGKSLAYISERAGASSLVVREPLRSPGVTVASGRLLRAPSWRPDGTVITFVASGPQGTRLNMVILSDPPVVKAVAPGEAAFAGPVAWLDRNRLLYAADGHIRERGFGELASTDIPFEATLQVSTVGDPPVKPLVTATDAEPVHGLAGMAVLPNGHIIVSALGDLWELGNDGALVRALTKDAYADRDPAASADGRWLAFTSDRDGTPQIWSMDLASGDTRQLTAESSFAGHPAWNSRGDALAYLAADDAGGRLLSLKVVDAGSRQVRQLAAGLSEPGTPAWAPGDTRVGLLQREQNVTRLLLYPIEGNGIRRVTLPLEAAGPGVNEAQWSRDGKLLLVASAAGIRVLPVLSNGLVGAEWRSLGDMPTELARWVPGEDAVLFTDAAGLARVGPEAGVMRMPVPLNWRPAPAPGRTIIRATRVFDGSHAEYLPNHEIVVEGNRIVALQPWFTATPEPRDSVIEARGKTVMPGLIDLSIELSEGAGERLGRMLLAYGITTAQVFAVPGAELREVAERWQYHAAGPRLLRSSEWCGAGDARMEPSAAIGEGAVRLCAGAIDRIPALVPPLRNAGTVIWSPAWLAASSGLVDAITPLGAPGTGSTLEFVTGPGVFGGFYQDAVDVLVMSGAVLVPGLARRGLPVLVDDQPDLVESPQYLALWRPGERQVQMQAWRSVGEREGNLRRGWLRDSQRLLGRIAAGGGRLAAASGSPVTPYGLGLQAEIRLLAGAGLPRVQALRMATSEAARAVGLQDQIGSLEPGHMADLLIIDGDPLADIRQLLRIETVMVDGHALAMSSLVEQLPGAAEKFTPPQKSRGAKQRRPQR